MKFKKTSLWTKLLILALIVYAAVTLVSLQPQIDAAQHQAELLAESKSDLEQENQELRDDIASLGTDEGVEKVARSQLGMRYSGEIDFQDAGQ